jgi:hypothetical protein
VNRLVRAVLAGFALVGGSAVAQTTGTSGEGKPPTPTPPVATPASAATATPAAPGALTLIGAATPQPANFDTADTRGRIARLPLFINSPENGEVLASFFEGDTGGEAKLNAARGPFPSGPPALFTDNNASPRAAKAETRPLPLRLGLAPGAPVSAATGLLVVNLKGSRVTPATLQIEGHGPNVSFTPAPVNFRVTRDLGPFSFLDHKAALNGSDVRVNVIGPGVAALIAGPPPPTALFRSDRGTTLDAELRLDNKVGANGVGKVILRAKTVEAVGKYSGQVTIDAAAASPTTLTSQIEVQDSFWYPLVWLLLTAGLGGYFVRRYNLRRRRSLLLATLEDAVVSYHTARRKADDLKLYEPGPHLMGGLDAKFPDKSDCGRCPDDEGKIFSVYCEVYDAVTDDEFAEVSAKVGEIIAVFSRWHQVLSEARTLLTTLTAVELPDSDVAARDTNDLLATLELDPETETATNDLIARLHGQHTVLGPYRALLTEWNKLSEDQKKAVANCDPKKVYTAATSRDVAATATLRIALFLAARAVAEEARKPSSTDEATAASEAPDPLTALAESASIAASVVAAYSEGVTGPPPPPPPLAGPAPTVTTPPPPRQPLGHFKRWDLIIFLVTAVLTAVAYLLPIYDTGVFGSWQDYVKLAAVGFLGSAVTGGLVLNWELFPPLRSYRPAPSAPPAPAV